METIDRITETIRIPNFFRDILFIMGGSIMLFLSYILFINETNRPFALAQFISSDLNIAVLFLLVSLSYFLGRINEMVAIIFIDFIAFFDNVFFFLANKKNIKKSIIQSVGIFFQGHKHQYPMEKIVSNNPNRPQVLSYYLKNKAASDENERSVYVSIIYDQLFAYSLIFSVILSRIWFVLSLFILWRMYKGTKDRAWHYNEIRRDIVFQNDQEANKKLTYLKSQGEILDV